MPDPTGPAFSFVLPHPDVVSWPAGSGISEDMSIEDGPGDTLSPSEGLDADEVRNDDGDEVVDPPEGWSEADKFGTTQREEQEGESLDQRLAEEEPDIEPETPPEVPVAVMPDDELTEDLVDEVIDEDADEDDGTVKHAEVVDGVIVEDSRVDRGQIDGSPEDGESIFPIVE